MSAMQIAEFCHILALSPDLRSIDKALAALFFFAESASGHSMSAYDLQRLFKEHGLGNPNPAQLDKSLRASGMTLCSSGKHRLRATSVHELRDKYGAMLHGHSKAIPINEQYLPEALWKGTRGYLEKVCLQLNGCIHMNFYDAAAVLLRRIMETLIIECYEKLQRQAEIHDKNGDYLMLGDLVSRVLSQPGLPVGRETKVSLNEVKTLGDRSAHNRRFNAGREDLFKIQSRARVAFQDLCAIADLQKKSSAAAP